MDEFLKVISKYNVVNYLIPGVILCGLLRIFTPYNLIQNEVVVGVFLYYFVGLVTSRVGSLIVEPILKKFKIIKFADYGDFIDACKCDPKIEVLSETNNSYRTFIAMVLLLGVSMAMGWLEGLYCFNRPVMLGMLFLSLLTLFIFSHRKQTTYIRKRINKSKA